MQTTQDITLPCKPASTACPVRGDSLGFDDIVAGTLACEAVALDAGEARTLHCRALLEARPQPSLLDNLQCGRCGATTASRSA